MPVVNRDVYCCTVVLPLADWNAPIEGDAEHILHCPVMMTGLERAKATADREQKTLIRKKLKMACEVLANELNKANRRGFYTPLVDSCPYEPSVRTKVPVGELTPVKRRKPDPNMVVQGVEWRRLPTDLWDT